MALKDKLMTLEDFKAVRDVDVASNSAKFTEIKADLGALSNLDTTSKSSIVDAINEIAASGSSGGDGLTDSIKSALMLIANNVAWVGDDPTGQTYIDALYDALYNASAIFINSASALINAIGSTYQLTARTVPAGINVTWSSSDTSVATVSSSGLVTAVGYGECTITTTSGNVSATCSVTVSQATLTSISAVYTQSGTVYETDSLSSLSSDLVVTAHWSNGTTSALSDSNYTLSGTLTVGTSTITVTYGGQTDTFSVTVTANSVTAISAVYTQSGRVYENTTLDSLKSDLVVTATYANGTTAEVESTDYTLSGTLAVGTSTVTVTYSGCTITFTVTVSDESTVPDGYTNIEYVQADNTGTSTASLQIAETGYIPTANTGFEYKIAYTQNRNSGHIISAPGFAAPCIRTNGGKYFANRCGNELDQSIGSTYAVGTPLVIKAYMDGTNDIEVNGTKIGTLAAGSGTPSNGLILFSYNATSTYTVAGRIYYLKIYESGTLVRHYVAAKRDLDDAVGFYDLVNDTFLVPPASMTPFTGPTE